jgi:hypothetical protein
VNTNKQTREKKLRVLLETQYFRNKNRNANAAAMVISYLLILVSEGLWRRKQIGELQLAEARPAQTPD